MRTYYNPNLRPLLDSLLIARYPTEGSKRIARETGISARAVAKRAGVLGLRVQDPGRVISAAYADRFAEYHAAIQTRYPTEGPGEIAREFNTSVGAVWKMAELLGVKAGTDVRARARAARVQACSHVNGRYFDSWSPNVAWLLGYIWTDGCVIEQRGVPAALAFTAAEQDGYIIHAIHRELQATAAVRIRQPRPCQLSAKRNQPQRQFTLRIGSQLLCSRLVNLHGILPRKSSVDHSLPSVPPEFFCHFARGVIDGDGSILLYKGYGNGDFVRYVGLCGTPQTAIRQFAERVAETLGVVTPPLRPTNSRCVTIRWGRRGDVRKILEWLYPEGDYLCLERKRAMATKILGLSTPAVGDSQRRV